MAEEQKNLPVKPSKNVPSLKAQLKDLMRKAPSAQDLPARIRLLELRVAILEDKK